MKGQLKSNIGPFFGVEDHPFWNVGGCHSIHPTEEVVLQGPGSKDFTFTILGPELTPRGTKEPVMVFSCFFLQLCKVDDVRVKTVSESYTNSQYMPEKHYPPGGMSFVHFVRMPQKLEAYQLQPVGPEKNVGFLDVLQVCGSLFFLN